MPLPNSAARVGDLHKCGATHIGGNILPPASTDVKTNVLPQARATDQLACAGPGSAPDFIITGSGTVLINGLPAARFMDLTMHAAPTAGQILMGSENVIIGGPTVGATLGNPGAGQAAFLAAAAGRVSGQVQQSYGNCGVESTRQVVNQATGANASENDLLNDAIKHGDAANSSNPNELGGTTPASRQSLLARNSVSSSLQDSTIENIAQAVAEKKGVITSHNVRKLWGPQYQGGHAVVTTGVEYNADGTVKNLIINDTGAGQGSRPVPASQYQESLTAGSKVNVTDDPIW